jgi:SAM-dependent methyltransferase
MTLHLDPVPASLTRDQAGLWRCGKQSSVSYPEDGNAGCLDFEETSFWFRHRNECIVNTVRRLPPDGPIVDIGGGNGFVAKALGEAGFEVILVEPGVAGAQAARRRGIEQVICGAFHDVGFASGSLHAAGLFDVLEHIEDDAGALREIHATLGRGGRIYLTVPAYPALYSAEDRVAGHFRRYTGRSLARAVAASGFRIEFSTYFFMPLPPAILLFRTVPSWLGMARADNTAAQHEPTGLGRKLVDRVLEREARRIAGGKRIGMGASCLLVGRKE